MGGEEGLEVVEEFYAEDTKSEQQQNHDLTNVQDMQKGLQQSVQALN